MDKQIAENEGAFVELLNQEMKELQESQKQIEKMVTIIQNAVGGCAKYWAELIAVALHKNDYGKIPEGAVVLTPAERDEEMRLIREDVIERMEATRKETAEKIAERLKERLDISVNGYSTSEVMSEIEDKIDEIAKEITEGDNE